MRPRSVPFEIHFVGIKAVHALHFALITQFWTRKRRGGCREGVIRVLCKLSLNLASCVLQATNKNVSAKSCGA